MGRPTTRSGWEAAGIAVIAAVIIAAYAYFSTSRVSVLFTFRNDDGEYYHYLVDGFLHGQLAMWIAPPPEFATLADPYDPLQRARIGQMGLHDAGYYKGRYYLYFGVAPAVALFLPFRLLTGVQFSQGLATVLFCAGGYLASLGLFLGLRRRFFPMCGAGTVWLGAVMLGLGNFCLPMLVRNSIWEVPISSAYFFSCIGYLLLFQAWSAQRWRVLRLAAAGTAFGLAVGSRPQFVFLAGIACVFWLWNWRDRARHGADPGWARGIRETAALFIPLGLIVAGLLDYNYQRFGDPFEFGIRYSLGGGSQVRAKLAGLEYWPANLYYNFLASAQFERYFPFFDVIRGYPGLRPADYAGSEDAYGVLPNMPFWLLALAAPIAWRFRFRQIRGLTAWMGLFGLGFLVLAMAILSFAGSANRYEVDFLPSLLLLAALGLLMLGCMDGPPRAGRRLVRLGAIGAVAYTAIFNVGAAFRHNGVFKVHRPDTYRALGSWFNRPAFLWDEWRHQPYGPVEITVRFPQNREGHVEPILVTGISYRSDYLYVSYDDPIGQSIRIGYTRTNHEEQLSQPIFLDGAALHRIDIESGALYPPEGHPYFAGWSRARMEEAKQTFRVAVDGVTYLQGQHDFFETTPGFLRFGKNDISTYVEPRFTGDIIAVRRQAPGPAIAPFTGGGSVKLAFVLPTSLSGRREPLIATGASGAGDLLFIEGEDGTHVRIGFHHSGSELLLSDPLPVVPGQIQLIGASMGSFYPHPRNADERELARALIVRFNGRLIWAKEQDFYAAGAPVASFGVNVGHSDACAMAFSGQWVAVQPVPSSAPGAAFTPFVFAPYWQETGGRPGYGPLRMHVIFPRDKSGTFEPLLVSGPSIPQADYIWIHYLDATGITLGYEHTSGGGPSSGVRSFDFTRPHVIEIEQPSLYPPQGDAYFSGASLLAILTEKSRARLTMDGVPWIDAVVGAYESTPEQTTVGENHISNTFGRRFTGRISLIERGVHAPPPGFTEQTGPIEMAVTWPESLPAGTREVLLATGGDHARDELLIDYADGSHARFVLQDHRGRTWIGEPFGIGSSRRATLRIVWGGFFPESARPRTILLKEWRMRQRPFGVWVDGTQVMKGDTDFAMEEPQKVNIGVGPDGSAAFSGSIRSISRLPDNP